MFGQGRRFAPVKEGDELDVKIEAVGEKGDGIAKKQGFVLFVPNTKTGDEVRVRVSRVLRNAGFAEVIGGSTGKTPEAKPAVKEEEDVAELEDAAKKNDSEEFGEDSDTTHEAGDDEIEPSAEEPAEEEADDADFKDE